MSRNKFKPISYAPTRLVNTKYSLVIETVPCEFCQVPADVACYDTFPCEYRFERLRDDLGEDLESFLESDEIGCLALDSEDDRAYLRGALLRFLGFTT